MDQRSLLASDPSSPGAEEEDVPAGNLVTHYRIREVIVDQVAVARNGYAATKESALNLAVGEGVLVLEYRGDGDIYQVKNRNGVVGLVPETVLSQPTSLWEFPWYHGAISREESERMLQGRTYGSYLVRDGHNDNYPHTLTLLWERGVLHYRIHRNITSGMLRIADDELFYTLAELVQYYSKDADGLAVALCYPVPKRESAARHSSGAAGIFGREKPRPGVASGQQSCNRRNVSVIYRVHVYEPNLKMKTTVYGVYDRLLRQRLKFDPSIIPLSHAFPELGYNNSANVFFWLILHVDNIFYIYSHAFTWGTVCIRTSNVRFLVLVLACRSSI